MDDTQLLSWATNLPHKLLQPEHSPALASALASRLSSSLPTVALEAVRQRVAAWQLRQPLGTAAAAPPFAGLAPYAAPEQQSGSGPAAQLPTTPTAAVLLTLARSAAPAQPEQPHLRPPTPAASSSVRPGALKPPGSRLAAEQPNLRPPGLAALPAVQGRWAGEQAAVCKVGQPVGKRPVASSQQQGCELQHQGEASSCGSTQAAAGPTFDRRHSRSARSKPKGRSLALAACCLPLAALLLLLLLARGAAEAPAGGLDTVLTSPHAWWLACSWAATAGMLCTHLAYVQAGWGWALALDAAYLLLLAGFWPVPINLLAAVGTLVGCRLLLLATARTQDSRTAWDPAPRKRHAGAGGKEHTPAIDSTPQNISSRMHYSRWQGKTKPKPTA